MLKSQQYHGFCIVLTAMCEKFGMTPSDYLFNDLACAHTRLAVDLTVFNVWAEWQDEQLKAAERKARLRNAS